MLLLKVKKSSFNSSTQKRYIGTFNIFEDNIKLINFKIITLIIMI